MEITCPKCANNDQGTILGHEFRTVYDGVLVWQCGKCGEAFPRRFAGMPQRTHTAQEFAEKLNEARNG